MTSSKRIRVTCDTKLRITLDELHGIQGDLKNMSTEDYLKFRKLVLKDGINFSMHVWKQLDGTKKKPIVKWWVIDGHGRLAMLRKLRDEEGFDVPKVPAVEIEAVDLQDAKRRVLSSSSSFNKMTNDGLYGFMSDAQLGIEDLEDYSLPEIDLPEFKMEYFEDAPECGGEGSDDVPPVPVVAKTKLGELWILGNHRLLIGDSTKREDVERLMAGEKADMVFTDPPYGVAYDGGTTKRRELTGDHNTDLYPPACLMAYDFSNAEAPLYLWHAGVRGIAAAAAAAAAAAKWEIRAEIIWNKNLAQFGALSAQYKQKHEPAYYCFKKGEVVNWCGPTNETTVWDCDRASKNDFHHTQKPVELAERAIKNHEAQTCLDLFLGSGSTLIACEKTGRKCFGMEIDPVYADVILQRYLDFTKKSPVRESDGALWSELAG